VKVREFQACVRRDYHLLYQVFMLNYVPSFSFLALTLLLSQVFACQSNHFVYRLESLNESEALLCMNQPNHRKVRGKIPLLTFRVRPKPQQQGDAVDTTSIEVVEHDKFVRGVKTTLLGKNFKKNETFTYQGAKWKILHIGHDGATVGNSEYCRYRFVHVKQIN
jgi:hypothetical protein